MRCCEECGCYLPDGHTKCLACGHDEKSKAIVKAETGYYTEAGGAGISGTVYTPYRPGNARLCYSPYYDFNPYSQINQSIRAQYEQLNYGIATLQSQIFTQQQCANLVNNIGAIGYTWRNNE